MCVLFLNRSFCALADAVYRCIYQEPMERVELVWRSLRGQLNMLIFYLDQSKVETESVSRLSDGRNWAVELVKTESDTLYLLYPCLTTTSSRLNKSALLTNLRIRNVACLSHPNRLQNLTIQFWPISNWDWFRPSTSYLQPSKEEQRNRLARIYQKHVLSWDGWMEERLTIDRFIVSHASDNLGHQ